MYLGINLRCAICRILARVFRNWASKRIHGQQQKDMGEMDWDYGKYIRL